MNRLDRIEETQLRNNIPRFQPGDTVRVHVRIKESETKERLQVFEGVVIARKHGGAAKRSQCEKRVLASALREFFHCTQRSSTTSIS